MRRARNNDQQQREKAGVKRRHGRGRMANVCKKENVWNELWGRVTGQTRGWMLVIKTGPSIRVQESTGGIEEG